LNFLVGLHFCTSAFLLRWIGKRWIMQQVFECVAVKFYFHSILKLWQILTKKLEKLVEFLFVENFCTVVTKKSTWFIFKVLSKTWPQVTIFWGKSKDLTYLDYTFQEVPKLRQGSSIYVEWLGKIILLFWEILAWNLGHSC